MINNQRFSNQYYILNSVKETKKIHTKNTITHKSNILKVVQEVNFSDVLYFQNNLDKNP